MSVTEPEPVKAEVIGLDCNSVRFTVDLTAKRVSYVGADGHTMIANSAQITSTSIDWVNDNPGIVKSEYHIDRSTGFMTSIVHYYARTYGAKPDFVSHANCQKTQGF